MTKKDPLIYVMIEGDDETWTHLNGHNLDEIRKDAESLLRRWYGFDDYGDPQAVDTIAEKVRFFAIPKSKIKGLEGGYIYTIFGDDEGLDAWDILEKQYEIETGLTVLEIPTVTKAEEVI